MTADLLVCQCSRHDPLSSTTLGVTSGRSNAGHSSGLTCPWKRLGETGWFDGTVTLDKHLLQAERRCTICHEIVHIERGPLPDVDQPVTREEPAVEREVAKHLVELQPLAEALAWSADALRETENVLRVRIDHSSHSEAPYLTARLALLGEQREEIT